VTLSFGTIIVVLLFDTIPAKLFKADVSALLDNALFNASVETLSVSYDLISSTAADTVF